MRKPTIVRGPEEENDTQAEPPTNGKLFRILNNPKNHDSTPPAKVGKPDRHKKK